MSINVLTIAGNLAASARHNRVNEKSHAVSFAVITNKRVKDESAEGGYRDDPTTYQVTRFVDSEEIAAKLASRLTKGRRVEVEGSYRKNGKPNTGTDGKTYHGWTLIADEVVPGAKPRSEQAADQVA